MAGIVVIANGRIQGKRPWEKAERRLRMIFGNGMEVRLTRHRGDATDLARDAVAAGADWIAAAGGDGTINEVVNGFFGYGQSRRPDARLSFLPCGTANDWARTMGVPLNLEDAVEALTRARERAVDVARAEFPMARVQRIFLNFAEAGAGAEVVRRLERSAGARRAGYVATAVLVASRYKSRSIRLRLNGSAPIGTGPLLSLVVAGGRYFGSGIRVAPMAEPDDGWLEVISIGDFSRAEILVKIGKFRRGEYMDESKVRHWKARELEVSAETPLPVLLDGELAGELPVRIRVLPRALTVRC